MVHYSYSKTPSGLGWTVEDAGTDYRGSRVLDAYAAEAVQYIRRLEDLFSEIEPVLRNAAKAT